MKFRPIFFLLSVLLALAAEAAEGQRVYVLPVETEIDQSAVHHFRRGCAQAKDWDADLLLVRLNTFGGALDAADSIRTTLLRMEIPTVAWVDINAASAGALIALACDTVYMAPGASMGSATVVNGAGEPMPEKYQSYMSTMMRATAEHHGRVERGDSMAWRRDPAIAASMVNPEVSVSLTARQAVDCGYAEGIASTMDDVLADLGMAGALTETYRSTFADDILGFLSNAAVRAILVMLILGGIYMEMHTPGLGFAAAVATVATVLYVLPVVIGGTMPAWVILAFLVGVVLLALEIFVIPGFGICGICGIVAVGFALTGVIVNNDAVTGFDGQSLFHALGVVGSGCLLAIAAVAYLTSKHGPKFVRRHTELMTELSNAHGFVGVDMTMGKYVGQAATTVTDMRPAGKIEIDGEVFDAVSTGAFIPARHHVKVIRFENAQLYVEPER